MKFSKQSIIDAINNDELDFDFDVELEEEEEDE
jgi:hypothetical protein